MKTEIEAALKVLIQKASESGVKSFEALQFTQAALNLAHVEQVLQQVKERK